MISYRDLDMPAPDNWNAQKLSHYGDQPAIDRTMGVKNIWLGAFDNFYQGKQGRKTEGPFHGQEKTGQVRMAELANPVCEWTAGLANNGNTVPAFEQ